MTVIPLRTTRRIFDFCCCSVCVRSIRSTPLSTRIDAVSVFDDVWFVFLPQEVLSHTQSCRMLGSLNAERQWGDNTTPLPHGGHGGISTIAAARFAGRLATQRHTTATGGASSEHIIGSRRIIHAVAARRYGRHCCRPVEGYAGTSAPVTRFSVLKGGRDIVDVGLWDWQPSVMAAGSLPPPCVDEYLLGHTSSVLVIAVVDLTDARQLDMCRSLCDQIASHLRGATPTAAVAASSQPTTTGGHGFSMLLLGVVVDGAAAGGCINGGPDAEANRHIPPQDLPFHSATLASDIETSPAQLEDIAEVLRATNKVDVAVGALAFTG